MFKNSEISEFVKSGIHIFNYSKKCMYHQKFLLTPPQISISLMMYETRKILMFYPRMLWNRSNLLPSEKAEIGRSASGTSCIIEIIAWVTVRAVDLNAIKCDTFKRESGCLSIGLSAYNRFHLYLSFIDEGTHIHTLGYEN